MFPLLSVLKPHWFTAMKTDLSNLEQLLRDRLSVIAYHAFSDRDPAGHLDKLREVSTALDHEFQKHRATLPARLNHFMTQSSYQKALEFIEACRSETTDPAVV